MGKAIALKLTDKEERIVNQLNQEGITHSELLRDALWHYFGSVNQSVNPVQHEKVNLSERETVNPIIRNYIEHLEDEIQHLREQNARLQEQIGGEITRLHGQIYRFSANREASKQISTPKDAKLVSDVHSDIDSFLKKEARK